MELIFSDSGKLEIENLEQELKSTFIKHLETMQSSPPQALEAGHAMSCREGD